ncbi:MAG: flagellar brake protein [Desulfovibrio sp.]|jgi:c-di-GMP-binding flagellar brake protein YcgR|nr:flagellar brake protein [Desulfovibrio sp.]
MSNENAAPVSAPGSELSAKAYQNAMPKLDLEQNTRVFVRVNPVNQQSQPLQGEFLGTSHYEFMILRLPSVPGLLNRLLPQTRVEIRYMQEGAVHTFITEIISHTVKPSLLLFTSYPDRMSIMDTRKHMRVMCALPITLHSAKGDGEGLICDLSLGGCRVVLELTGQSSIRELAVGDAIVVQTVLNSKGVPYGIKGAVRNVELAGTRMAAGLSFSEKGGDFLKPLDNYVKMAQTLI